MLAYCNRLTLVVFTLINASFPFFKPWFSIINYQHLTFWLYFLRHTVIKSMSNQTMALTLSDLWGCLSFQNTAYGTLLMVRSQVYQMLAISYIVKH